MAEAKELVAWITHSGESLQDFEHSATRSFNLLKSFSIGPLSLTELNALSDIEVTHVHRE